MEVAALGLGIAAVTIKAEIHPSAALTHKSRNHDHRPPQKGATWALEDALQ